MNVRHFVLCTLSLLAPVAVLVLASYDLLPLGFAVPAAVGATFLAALVNMLVARAEHADHAASVQRIG